MPPRPPPPEPIDLPVSTSRTLMCSFTTFLTIAIHSILRARHLYPPSTFLLAHAYNTPVHQSRHPALCTWITDAVAAVAATLSAGNVGRVVIAVHAGPRAGREEKSARGNGAQSIEPGGVLERWVFDTSRLPAFPGGLDAPHDQERALVAEDELVGEGDNGDNQGEVNWADVDEQYRGALLRLTRTGEAMPPVDKGSTFTVAVELKEDGEAPIAHPQPWIPSNPPVLVEGASRTHPVRAVRAGPMFFDCWMEESVRKPASGGPKGKGQATPNSGSFGTTESQKQRQAVTNAPSASSS